MNFPPNVLSGEAPPSLLDVDAPRHDVGRDDDLFVAFAESVEHLKLNKRKEVFAPDKERHAIRSSVPATN